MKGFDTNIENHSLYEPFPQNDVITQNIFPKTEGEPDSIVSIDNNLKD